MKNISADYIFTGNNGLLKNGLLTLDDDGTIMKIAILDPYHKLENLIIYDGILCPGFINTHCHLELSFMHQQLQKKTGLPDFIKNIVQLRNNSTKKNKIQAIEFEEENMIKAGIVAVADISNDVTTFSQKAKQNLYYHTFLELFQLDENKAALTLLGAKKMKESYPIKENISIAPHAPYSVSKKLMQLISEEKSSLLTIHNQETVSENSLFSEKNGLLYEQLFAFNPIIEKWKPTKKSSLQSYLAHLKNFSNLLLVHNTYTSEEDIAFANANFNSIFWCFCPNANLYIEDKLPNFSFFKNECCTIGTDSLASNSSLSIIEELKTISQATTCISLEKMLRWATYNGAKFLNIENQFGSFEEGKKPGVNLIKEVDLQQLRLTLSSSVEKLF